MENINLSASLVEKVLGMIWIPKEDAFKFIVNITLEGGSNHQFIPDVITPRMMLSQVARIYDPMGLVAPFTVGGREGAHA